jgi:hypothetical protein
MEDICGVAGDTVLEPDFQGGLWGVQSRATITFRNTISVLRWTMFAVASVCEQEGVGGH